jgi:hypothetical protein
MGVKPVVQKELDCMILPLFTVFFVARRGPCIGRIYDKYDLFHVGIAQCNPQS